MAQLLFLWSGPTNGPSLHQQRSTFAAQLHLPSRLARTYVRRVHLLEPASATLIICPSQLNRTAPFRDQPHAVFVRPALACMISCPCLVPRRLALLRLHNCTLLPAVKAIQLCWRAASSAILQSLALCIYAAAAGQWLPPLKTNVCQGERTTVQNYFVQIYQPNLRLDLKTDRSIKFHRQPYQIRLQEQRKLY